jgi:hypothetical protein
VVVLKHHLGKTIRVHPDKLEDADSEGGTGEFARWQAELDGDYVKFKSVKTGKYLRIWQNGKDVDVDGGGGPFTLFRVHVVEAPNVVKLESERFSGRYLAVNEHGKVIVGEGGNYCVIRVCREGAAELHPIQQQVLQNQGQHHQQPQQPQQQQQQQHQPEHKADDKNLNDDAKQVKRWLESIHMEQYAQVLLSNGFDRLSSVGELNDKDLEKMNIALGHRKVFLAAAHLAPYAGKKIALRSLNYNTYISGDKLDKGKDATSDIGAEKNLNEECIWLCNPLQEGKMTLSNVKHHGYLRIPKIIDKEACTQNQVDDRCELQIIPVAEHHGQISIFCPNNGNYLSCKEANMFGKTTLVAKPHVGKQECFTVIVRD